MKHMGESTGISWCDHTFNAWWGCTEVGGSPACGAGAAREGEDFAGECYAKTWDRRMGGDNWGVDAPRRFFGAAHWNEPLKWNRKAEAAGQRHRVFCMSMGDWAEGRSDQIPRLERLWDMILNTPWLDWLMLTKRPQMINRLCPLRSQRIWQGTTTETQRWLDIRWPFLRDVDAEIRWLSIEPLFERMVLPQDFLALGKRAWAIVGGQSGPGSIPMNPDWARYLRDQCVEAGVPYFFKQHGEWAQFRDSGLVQFPPNCATVEMQQETQPDQCRTITMCRIGKKAAGDYLDGRQWHQFPEPAVSNVRQEVLP